jgi:hypothetical protein
MKRSRALVLIAWSFWAWNVSWNAKVEGFASQADCEARRAVVAAAPLFSEQNWGGTVPCWEEAP